MSFKRYGDSHFKKTVKCVRQLNENYLAKVKAENPIDIDICQTLSTEIDEIRHLYQSVLL